MAKEPKPSTKKEKVIRPEKLMENAVKSVFFQDTIRRQPILHRGFTTDSKYYTVGSGYNNEDQNKTDVVFGNPNLTLGVIEVTDTATKDHIEAWLSKFGAVGQPRLMHWLLSPMNALSSKVKWCLDEITLETDPNGCVRARATVQVKGEAVLTEVVVGLPMESVFTLNVIAQMRKTYLSILEDQSSCLLYPAPKFEPSGTNMVRVLIPRECVKASPLASVWDTHIRIVATRGVDCFDTRVLDNDKKSYRHNLVFAHIGGDSLAYGSLIETDLYREVISRCCVYLIPEPNLKGT